MCSVRCLLLRPGPHPLQPPRAGLPPRPRPPAAARALASPLPPRRPPLKPSLPAPPAQPLRLRLLAQPPRLGPPLLPQLPRPRHQTRPAACSARCAVRAGSGRSPCDRWRPRLRGAGSATGRTGGPAGPAGRALTFGPLVDAQRRLDRVDHPGPALRRAIGHGRRPRAGARTARRHPAGPQGCRGGRGRAICGLPCGRRGHLPRPEGAGRHWERGGVGALCPAGRRLRPPPRRSGRPSRVNTGA